MFSGITLKHVSNDRREHHDITGLLDKSQITLIAIEKHVLYSSYTSMALSHNFPHMHASLFLCCVLLKLNVFVSVDAWFGRSLSYKT